MKINDRFKTLNNKMLNLSVVLRNKKGITGTQKDKLINIEKWLNNDYRRLNNV